MSFDPEQYGRCWCSRPSWDGHRHFGMLPVEFNRPAKSRLSVGERALLVMAALSFATSLFFLLAS